MDIYSLLKFGKSKSLELGLDHSSVLDGLKATYSDCAIQEFEMNGVTVITCEGIEVNLVNNRVTNIIIKLNHYWGKFSLSVGSDDRKIHRKTSIQRFTNILYEAKIEWEVFKKYCQNKTIELITEGSASVEFIAEGRRITINRIHLTEGDEYCGMKGQFC